MSKSPINREVALAGQQVRRKVIFALTLCSVIPLLVLTYVIHGHLVPGLEPSAMGMTDAELTFCNQTAYDAKFG